MWLAHISVILIFSCKLCLGFEYGTFIRPLFGGHMLQMHNRQKMNIVKEYILDFCTIRVCTDNIAIFEFNDGVNVDGDMVAELTCMAAETMPNPFGILSNRIHSYSLSFEAMTALAQYDNIIATAIVVHSAKSRMLVEAQNFFISALKKKPIKIFTDFDVAYFWLQETLKEAHKNS